MAFARKASQLNEKGMDINSDIKWQFACNITQIGIWDFNARQNRVFFSNASKSIIGFENDDSFGKNPDDWNNRVHPEDKNKYFQDFQDHLNGLKPIYENEHRVKCKDGSYKWIQDKGQIIEKDEQGNPLRIIGTHVEITNHVENEEKLANTLNILTKQNNKLQNFAHIVTHNLKQHAGNFESLLGLYQEAKTVKEKQETLSYLKVLSEGLSKTIFNLNKIVSVQNNKNTKIDKLFLANEVDNILDMLDMVITESKATIINNIDKKLFIYYNSSYLESIIQNLLTNAIKYKHLNRDPKIELSSNLYINKLEISISDNGLGIDLAKYGDKIFGLYKTFHNNDEAEGVGLYLIKNQIEAFGGSISLESTVNVGSTFTISIPN